MRPQGRARPEALRLDGRAALRTLGAQLGWSRSQLIDEAVSLFLKAVTEARRGRQLLTWAPEEFSSLRALTTPTLTALSWERERAALQLPNNTFDQIQLLSQRQKPPSDRLRAAAKRRHQITARTVQLASVRGDHACPPTQLVYLGPEAVDLRAAAPLAELGLLDALLRVVQAAPSVECLGVIVEAKNEDAERFYAKYGFETVQTSWPRRMFLPIEAARAAFSAD